MPFPIDYFCHLIRRGVTISVYKELLPELTNARYVQSTFSDVW